MAVGDFLALVARHVTIGAAIDGVTHALIGYSQVVAEEPPAAGRLGEGGQALTMERITVSVFGNNPNALNALVGAAAANCVIGFKGADGVNTKVTLKNVAFTRRVSGLTFPPIDAGGKVPPFGVEGRCEWGADDTHALMEVFAADA